MLAGGSGTAGFGAGGVRGGAVRVCEVLTALLSLVVRVLTSVWHLRMLADPVWVFVVGLLPMHFVAVGLLVLLLLLLPVWFLLVLLVVAEFTLVELPVAPVLVEVMRLLWLFLVLLLLVGCLL